MRDQYGNLKQRYLYANGRPLRVDILDAPGTPSYYYRYNARGDATFVPKDGNGGTGWRAFGAWGEVNYGADIKGYYNWNAAWGYMQFPVTLNIALHDAMDMGLYYAHGRWYNQDTGLWLSPNDKGDYLIAATPDPINKGWVPLLAPQQQQHELPNHGYIHTTNWGFFDINHITGGHEHAEQILNYFDNLADTQPLRLQTGPIGITQFTEELVVRYRVNRPIPEQLKPAVALSIFLDYEHRWERLQWESQPHQMGSGYSIEDLPSDYLGFYSAVSRQTVPVILTEILKEKEPLNIDNSKPWWADSKWAPMNRSINPWTCGVDTFRSLMFNRLVLSCEETPWPNEMRITPIDHPERYWQFVDCAGTRRINAGPLHGAYPVRCE